MNKYKNSFSNGYTENWSKEKFLINSVLKTNTSVYKTKDLHIKNMIRRFYEKELLLSNV